MDFKKAIDDLNKCETKEEIWAIDDEVFKAALILIGSLKVSKQNREQLYRALEANRHAVRRGR